MPDSNWQGFVDQLAEGLKAQLKAQIQSLVDVAKTSGDDLVKSQAQDLTKYLNQLATGEIDKEDFRECVEGLQDDLKLAISQNKIAEKASAQRFIDAIESTILNGLFNLLP